MDKHLLHASIEAALTENYDVAYQAAQQAYETATHEENVAENKYDTLGLEASYLAEGQARRVAQCDQDIQGFKSFGVKEFSEDDAIAVGALVGLRDGQGLDKLFFVSPVAGGLNVMHEGESVLLVTVDAPLGKALLGAFLDDELVLGEKTFEIISLY